MADELTMALPPYEWPCDNCSQETDTEFTVGHSVWARVVGDPEAYWCLRCFLAAAQAKIGDCNILLTVHLRGQYVERLKSEKD